MTLVQSVELSNEGGRSWNWLSNKGEEEEEVPHAVLLKEER